MGEVLSFFYNHDIDNAMTVNNQCQRTLFWVNLEVELVRTIFRSSSANAAVAFAVATAGSSNPRDLPTKVVP